MVGAVSAWWMGSVEGKAPFWATAQTGCPCPAMGLRCGDAEESVATEVRVCIVDAGDGGDAYQIQVWRDVECQFGRTAAGATRHHLPEAFAPRARARRGSGATMAQEGISKDQSPCAARQSRDFLRRCCSYALGSSRGAHVGQVE